MQLGALEAGGTKMNLAIGNENGEIINHKVISTKSPEETIPRIVKYFKFFRINALGIATFGPVELDKQSDKYGYILNTPKLEWKNYPLLNSLKEALDIPVTIETDVNGSCIGEITYGSSKGLSDVIYITIGTGIGAGILSGGNLVHGMLHPEAGHIPILKKYDDPGECVCPYHRNCFEGMASGPSLEKRWGQTADKLIDRDDVWEIEADYIAQALINYIMILSPKRIILGGGVMHVEKLLPLVRRKVKEKLGDYIQTKELSDMDNYIITPSLGDQSGLRGAIKMAIDLLS